MHQNLVRSERPPSSEGNFDRKMLTIMENARSVNESQVDSETKKQIEMLTQLAEQMRQEKH